jgi:transposase
MSLKPQPINPVPEETVRVARAAFPKGNLYLTLRDEIGTLYWLKLMHLDDLRALTPLTWGHINPYGTFRLDLDERLLIDPVAS